MSFTRVNPGGWAVNDPLTSAQMNQLDINVSQAVDGTAGGTFAPSATIQINGSGFGTDNLRDSTLTSGQTLIADGVLDIRGSVLIDDGGTNTAGRIQKRFRATTVDSNETVRGTTDVQDVFIFTGQITGAGKTKKIDSSAVNVTGEPCRIYIDSVAAFTLDIESDPGTANPIATFLASPTDPSRRFFDIMFDKSLGPGGEWFGLGGSDDTNP